MLNTIFFYHTRVNSSHRTRSSTNADVNRPDLFNLVSAKFISASNLFKFCRAASYCCCNSMIFFSTSASSCCFLATIASMALNSSSAFFNLY